MYQQAKFTYWEELMGALTWKGGTEMCSLQDPLSRLFCRSQDPQLMHTSVHKPLIWRKMWNFQEKCDTSFQKAKIKKIWQFSAQIWLQFSVKKLGKFCKIPVLKPLFKVKSHSQAPAFIAIYPLTSPQVRKFRLHIPTRKKVECPPPEVYHDTAQTSHSKIGDWLPWRRCTNYVQVTDVLAQCTSGLKYVKRIFVWIIIKITNLCIVVQKTKKKGT